MTRIARTSPRLLSMTLVAGLLALPMLAYGQMPATTPMTEANPPGTVLGRATTGALAALAAPFASLPGSVAHERQRMTQIIGARVYNDANEPIGDIDEVLLNGVAGIAMPGPVAVVQVGGFLGLGGRLVLVPLGDLRWNGQRERITLPGATKETLEARPAFEYSALRRG